jgi:hypothetical protein
MPRDSKRSDPEDGLSDSLDHCTQQKRLGFRSSIDDGRRISGASEQVTVGKIDTSGSSKFSEMSHTRKLPPTPVLHYISLVASMPCASQRCNVGFSRETLLLG